MNYILRRTNRPGYVACSGHKGSYTTSLKYAKKYPDKEAAIADSCIENEVPIDLEQIIGELRQNWM